MKNKTNTNPTLTAAEGKTLTNGKDFGKEVRLGTWDTPDNWTEITDAEAEKIQAEREAAELPV